jgi:hypothetical protein
MMRRDEIAISATAFVGALFAFAPAEIAVSFASDAAPGFTYAVAEGTIWNGRVAGAGIEGVPLGEIRWRANPVSVLGGRIDARVSIAGGALNGEGRAALGVRAIALRDGDFQFRLDAIRKYTLFGAPYAGEARIAVEHFKIDRAGCADARATISTSALDASLQRLGLSAMPLSGALSCEGGALVATLNGENKDGRLEIVARATPAQTYALDVRALPARRDLGEALAIAGFERDGQAMTFRASGQMKGIGS